MAAAHLAGAVADLLGWGLAQDNARGMDSNVARAYLIRGARRLDGVFYPNPETGFGPVGSVWDFPEINFILRSQNRRYHPVLEC